jgi:hypothetical protein
MASEYTYYTTADLHAMPDDTRLAEFQWGEEAYWRPLVVDGQRHPSDWVCGYGCARYRLPAYRLKEKRLRRIK